MTCDELFELITDEDHTESDECRTAMKGHLARCRNCRRLADALEPAVALFRECSAGKGLAAPPLVSGPWHEPEALPTQLASVRAQAEPVAWLLPIFNGDLLRLAAALLVGLTLGALVWAQDEAPSPSSGSALAIGAPAVSAPRVTLASLLITAACLPEEHRPLVAPVRLHLVPASDLLASADLDALACCTSCHASLGMAANSKSATLQVVRSCQACHKS